MYIIAKKNEKDYYDGVAGTTGIDKTVVYQREIIELDEDRMPEFFRKRGSFWKKHNENPFRQLGYHRLKKEFRNVCDEQAYFIVGFCGRLYIGWKLYREIDKTTGKISTEFTYDIDYMKSILEEKSWHGSLEDSINYIRNFDAIQIFRDLNAPVFVYDGDYGRCYIQRNFSNHHKANFIINALLKDYEFFKVVESFHAFQEIQMFMGGVLGKGEKEIIEVADKYKITQHGFDYKWSFRKEPKNKKT